MISLKPLSLDTGVGIENLYRQIVEALEETKISEPLFLDCTNISFVRPESIIALITVARLWHRSTAQKVHLHNIPPSVHQYLERMDLFTQCESWLVETQQLPEWKRFDRAAESATLLEVLPIASDEGQNTRDLLVAQKRASRILRTWFDAETGEVVKLLAMLSEIGSNVCHSQDRGFVVIQRYRDLSVKRDSGRVAMVVSDLGIGIEQSLRNKPIGNGQATAHLEEESDYILHALQLGVTGRNEIAGLGLPRVKQLVAQWNGVLVIRSRRSRIQASAEGVRKRNDLIDIPGTQVTILIRGALDA